MKFINQRFYLISCMTCPDELCYVYEPAEDTYLLLKAALKEARQEDFALEVGCGTGLISSSLLSVVRSIIAVDINPRAVAITKRCGIDTIRADLLRGLKAKFDLVLFNPPYLPTCDEEKLERWSNIALDGGPEGRDTIKRFLEQLESCLSPQGRALLLVSSLTGVREVREIADSMRFDASEIACEKHFFEQLYVLKVSRSGI